MGKTSRLPKYETLLEAYHRAFNKEIQNMMEHLPVRGDAHILDAGSGDGFFTQLLANRIGNKGRITCVDVSTDFLKLARSRLKKHPRIKQVWFKPGNILKLPFPDRTFDFAWCAQSLFSFPDPVPALKELRRVVKIGGRVAVLENDTLHQLLLPWPPDVELWFRSAELKALLKQNGNAEKFYIGRDLSALFRAAGLTPEVKRTFAWDRLAPFTKPCRLFFSTYLKDLRERIGPSLTPKTKRLCDPYLNPASSQFLLKDPLCNVTVIDHIMWGKKNRP